MAARCEFPGWGALVVPSKYGRRFDHGHFVINGTHLFVTAGVGSAEPPLRLWCQPDIFIVDVGGNMADLRILVIADDPLARAGLAIVAGRAAGLRRGRRASGPDDCPRWLKSIAPTYYCGI